MDILCYNCKAEASFRCIKCPILASFYCKSCKTGHEHVTELLLGTCHNCEQAVAKNICIRCMEDNYTDFRFCLSCSKLHVQLKQFKKHVLSCVAVNDQLVSKIDHSSTESSNPLLSKFKTQSNEHFLYLSSQLVDYLDSILSDMDLNNWRSMLKGLVIAFIIHVISHFLIGRKPLVLYLFLALVLYLLYYKQQNSLRSALRTMEKVSH